MKEWTNWSGSLRFQPKDYVKPADEGELADIARKCYTSGKPFRLAAAGHSSTPLVKSTQTLINLENFKGIVRHDNHTATLRAGMTVHESNIALQKLGLALFNTGDVDVQTLAGAIATGTHGSGRKLQNLASILTGVKMVNYKGELLEFNDRDDPEIMKAARVSLGTLGIFSEITVKVVPLFKLRRIEICTDTDTCLYHFNDLANENRNVDFYWYPRSDEAKIRIHNEPGSGTSHFDFRHRRVEDVEDYVGLVLPKKRELKFDEMEYALPQETGLHCFREIRKRIKERHRKEVAWRVLYRRIASDDNYISPHQGRESVSISLHHNAGLPFDDYFNDIEPIFQFYGGRPHWAKKHNMTAEKLAPLYPGWSAFHGIRKKLDPGNFLLNEYLQKLLIQND
jgi:FAD/FMN-containing dehydrogenase